MTGMLRVALLATVGTVLLSACKNDPVTPEIDERPPDFVLPDVDGNAFQLSSTEGKVVLLHFFATWCPTCQSEAPILGDLYKTYRNRGFEIVAVAIQSTVEDALAYRLAYDLTFPVLMDDNVVSRLGYGIRTVPTNFLIDRDVLMTGPYGPLSKDDFEELILPKL